MNENGEVLVALLKDKSDFAILKEQGWYRIPVKSAPKRWPPRWLAFYQPKAFEDDAYRIRYCGEISGIDITLRKELFPDEIQSTNSDKRYYRISLKSLEERESPIISTRPRRLVFIPTTRFKFEFAEQINDLFDDSPLEDRLWDEFKNLKISAERQWEIRFNRQLFFLDFAVFCNKGNINVETDGDTWHARKERIPLDNQRDNALTNMDWRVLRFNGSQIKEQMKTYCLENIYQTINKLGGLNDEGLVPRKFFTISKGTGQQLSMFEKPNSDYLDEDSESFNLD